MYRYKYKYMLYKCTDNFVTIFQYEGKGSLFALKKEDIEIAQECNNLGADINCMEVISTYTKRFMIQMVG